MSRARIQNPEFRSQKPRRLVPACFVISTVVLFGCTSVRLDNSARLIARPDFPAARAAAPEWCRDALKTINALEAQLETK